MSLTPRTRQSVFATVLACAFVATVAVTRQATVAASSIPQPTLASLPLSLNDWEGADAAPPDAETAKILAADQYLHRYYVGEAGEVEVDVAYYSQRRVGASMHSPLNCLPGNGWTVSSSRDLTLSTPQGPRMVRELAVRRNKALFAMAYWYQSRERVLTGELSTRFQLLTDSLRQRPADVSLVRVMTPLHDENGSERRAVASFAAQLIPELSATWGR
jgi:EpsI family protein